MTRGLSEGVKRHIIELRREGHTWTQISWALKLTKGQVAGVLFRAGETKKREQATCFPTEKNKSQG